MANRMIHTPSYFNTQTLALEYWDNIASTIAISSGFYTRSASAPSLTKIFDSQSGWTVGFKFKFDNSAAAVNPVLITLLDGATTHVDLRWTQATQKLNVTRNGTSLGSGTAVLAVNTEYYIEVQFTISDTTGTAIVKVDGTTDINLSSQDTRNGGNASADQVQFLGTNAAGGLFIKDFYVNDNAGGVDDTFWGPIAIVTLTPSSAGNKSQWTPLSSTNVSNVDDTNMDGDTTYNATSTNGNIDSFTATDTGYSSGTVKGVEWAAEMRRTDASSTARIAPLWRIGGTDYVGTDQATTTTYRVLTQRYRVSPATSTAWTVSELDGAEVGYKRTAA